MTYYTLNQLPSHAANIMTLDEIKKLQMRLPAGIKINLVHGDIRYSVRTSRNGKKYSLGTFLTIDDAVDALYAFKTKLMDEPVTSNSQSPSKITFEQAQEIFDEIGVHNLESNKSYKHMTDDGEIIMIPAKYVDMYIHLTYYGSLPEAIEQKQKPKEVQVTDL